MPIFPCFFPLFLLLTLQHAVPSLASHREQHGEHDHYTLVAIGAGSGGLACARRAAAYGVRVAIVEEALIGGTCVNWGCMPKKVMWLGADLGESKKAFPFYGFLSSSFSDTAGTHAKESCCSSEEEEESSTEGPFFAAEKSEKKEEKRRRSCDICFSWKEMKRHRDLYIARLRNNFQEALQQESITFFPATASFLPAAAAAATDTKKDTTETKKTDTHSRHALSLAFKDGSTKIITADHVVIATGARRMRATHIRGSEFTLETDHLFLLKKKPKKIAILGSGYSATELSSILAALGVEVHLFFRAQRLLARDFDQNVIDVLEKEMERSGVKFHRSVRVVEVSPSDASGAPAAARYMLSLPSSMESSSKAPSCSSSSSSSTVAEPQEEEWAWSQQKEQQQQKSFFSVHLATGESFHNFNVVIAALGISPAVQTLQLANVGVETQVVRGKEGYVVVDKFQNTTAPRIYAVGDVTGKGMLASSAVASGRLLADRLFANAADAYLDLSLRSSVIFSFPPVAAVGLTEGAAAEVYGKEEIEVYTSSFVSTFYGPWLVEREAKRHSFIKLICLKKDSRIVGLHMTGRSAEEIIQGFAVAIRMGARKRDFDNTLAMHPTSAEEVVTLRPWRKSSL